MLLMLFLGFSAQASAGDTLDEKLEPFRGFVGTWQASMTMGKDKPPVLDVSHWQIALNGKALKIVHSVNDGDYGGESFIFWDKKSSSYKSFYFTTADFYTEATITLEADNKFSVIEKVASSGEGLSSGITKVKSTSEMKDGRILVSTSYYKNGEWTKPESRVYIKSQLTPKFKH
ncbi:hypothetical protein G8768_14485 [Pseudoteredinibacter isoporae]|nr:hypothetical protein [Pseudoteredinibacter isoporae]NIB23497.1 hypothetical protein [Pseudoteredinibacter isoporae]